MVFESFLQGALMKKATHLFATLLVGLSLLLVACDDDANDPNSENNTLYVKFSNSSSSEFTITDIYHMDMGVAGLETPSPSGEWSANILTDGKTVAPGESVFFTLNIPNTHWSQCRFGVLDENTNHVFLHEQAGQESNVQAPITHWGSDERTVEVTIKRNTETYLIMVTAWSDWAGID